MVTKNRHKEIVVSLEKMMEKIDHLKIFDGSSKIVLISTGNPFRSDDGVGPYIAGKLAPFTSNIPFINLINAEIEPENFIDEVVSFLPDYIFFIDAANFGKEPGEFILLDDGRELPTNSVSTHTLPINLITAMIKSECDCTIMYIGIQVNNMQFGDEISSDVKIAADMFIQKITDRIRILRDA